MAQQITIPLLTLWEKLINDLFKRTEKFPKHIRMTLSHRIENCALNIYEDLVEARYSTQRQPILYRINRQLETLRLLIRLCHTQTHLSHGGYQCLCEMIDEAGKMLGGWIHQQKQQ